MGNAFTEEKRMHTKRQTDSIVFQFLNTSFFNVLKKLLNFQNKY